MYGTEEYRNFIKTIKNPPPTTLRRNSIKVSEPEFESILLADGIQTTPVPWFPDARITTNNTTIALGKTNGFMQGYFYIQSLSSMIPPLILNPKPQETILDMCAAPGSKTTQIAMLMNNSGIIIANDTSHIRSLRLAANLKTQGVSIAQITNIPGERIWMSYPEYFDKTLVDVPCSMEGTIRISDPKTYSLWSKNKVKELSKKQRWLLRSAISATKPGGTIVYSTCTLSPEENEEIIDWILEKEKGNIETVEVDNGQYPFSEPIMKWKNHTYHQDVLKTRRIKNTNIMEGFFIAKIIKTQSTIPSNFK